MNLIAYKINVKGRVTGVCFRACACEYSQRFGFLRGYVRNVCSMEVEAVVQGEENDVMEMIEWFTHGPSYARVDSITSVPVPVDTSLGPFGIVF